MLYFYIQKNNKINIIYKKFMLKKENKNKFKLFNLFPLKIRLKDI